MFTAPPRLSRSNVKHVCAALFAGLLAAAPLAEAIPITIGNNSFEAPDISDFVYNPSGATWTFNKLSGISEPPSGFGGTAAPDGSQYAFIQATSNFSQALTFPASGNYTLAFLAAGRPSASSVIGGNQSYQVLLDSLIIFADVTTTGSPFIAEQSDPFFATAGGHTLTFAGLVLEDQTLFIDAVAINSVPNGTVPEPATLALLGIGLAGLAARRRKAS